MTQTITTRAKRRCRKCNAPRPQSDFHTLPNGVRNIFCHHCVARRRRLTLDKLNAKRVKASWEVSR